MKKIDKDDKVLNDVIESIKRAEVFLVETNEKTAVCGSTMDVLHLFSSQVSELMHNTGISADMLRTAFEIGVDAYNEHEGNEEHDEFDKEMDKKLQTIEKLMEMLKELRKEVE